LIVGINFSYNSDLAYQKISDPLDSLQKCLQLWSIRGLTIIGKIQIVKTLLIPKFLYTFSLIEMALKDIKKISTILYQFIWRGPDKVARNTMIGEIKDGGLNMLDIFALYHSLKIKNNSKVFKLQLYTSLEIYIGLLFKALWRKPGLQV